MTFADMPDVLVLQMTEEDVHRSPAPVRKHPFCCPIALKVQREVGHHQGITRKRCSINGAMYEPKADAIGFMDDFDDRRPTGLPRTVTFVRVRPRA